MTSPSTRHLSRPSLGQRTISQGSTTAARISGPWGPVAGVEDTGMEAEQPLPEERRDTLSGEKRARSSSRGNGRVEKHIEATLPQTEQTSNARSRKSSHMLGLFKENTAAQDSKKAQDKTKSDLSALGDRASQRAENEAIFAQEPERSYFAPGGKISEDHVTSSNDLLVSEFDIDHGQAQATERNENLQWRRKSSVGSTIVASRENGSVQRECRDEELTRPISDDTCDAHSHKKTNEADPHTSPQLPREIKSDQDLVGQVSEESCSYCSRASWVDRHPSDKDGALKHQSIVPEGLDESVEPRLVSDDSEALGDDEEDSDKEQISSALYYPHQAPSPDALGDPDISPEGSGQGSGDTEKPLLEPLPPSALSIDVQSEDVDITLQSQHKSRYLHGDLQNSWVSQGSAANIRVADVGQSSTSGSEYEDDDEAALSTNGEDSSHTDEPETTPTATPIPKNRFLRPRDKKHRRPSTAPIRAVELKPYNHQVGGHSTVFRFSRRAVCKQLSNRENEFYEVVEREHPELLKFLPR